MKLPPTNLRPATIAEIDTPAVLIDIDRVERNIIRAQAAADAAGVKLRPHIKTHKLPGFAARQVAAGAVGITCQKIGEAEEMAKAGLTDIFLPYNIIGRAKLERLLALHQTITISVSADNAPTIAGLAETFTDSSHPLKVMIECDTGAGRCGVQTAQQALALAQQITAAEGLTFGGLMTYPLAGAPQAAEAWLTAARNLLEAEGFACHTVSSGGTPDMWRRQNTSIITEYRPGTYIYMDRYQIAKGAACAEDCALTVLATVVSTPTTTRAILDSGSKALSSDLLGLADYGELIGMESARVTALSEEHATVDCGGAGLSVGDRVRILPNHACVVSNLFNEVYLVSGDRVIDILPVAARGKMG